MTWKKLSRFCYILDHFMNLQIEYKQTLKGYLFGYVSIRVNDCTCTIQSMLY